MGAAAATVGAKAASRKKTKRVNKSKAEGENIPLAANSSKAAIDVVTNADTKAVDSLPSAPSMGEFDDAYNFHTPSPPLMARWTPKKGDQVTVKEGTALSPHLNGVKFFTLVEPILDGTQWSTEYNNGKRTQKISLMIKSMVPYVIARRRLMNRPPTHVRVNLLETRLEEINRQN